MVVRSFQPSATRIWEVSTGELVTELTAPWSGLALDFTPDGDYLVLGTPEGLVSILDFRLLVEGATPEDAEVQRIPAHNSLIIDLDVSPDGSTIGSSAWDQPARLWDLESGQLLSEFGSQIRTTIAFHPNRPWLYVAEGQTISIHTLDTHELLDIARQRLTRHLTSEECVRYLKLTCDPDTRPTDEGVG